MNDVLILYVPHVPLFKGPIIAWSIQVRKICVHAIFLKKATEERKQSFCRLIKTVIKKGFFYDTLQFYLFAWQTL